MKPLRDLLVIEIQEESKEKSSESGFLFQAPKWAKPQNVARVVAKGPLVNSVSEGELVYINPYAYQDTEDKLIKLIREKDILCQVDETK